MFEKVHDYYKRLVPGMSVAEWKALESKLTVQQLTKGSLLIRQGEVSRSVSFINKGLVRIYYLSDGKEINTGFIAENEYVSSYSSFLTRQPSAENIDALEDCELINLSFESMQELYLSHPIYERFGRKIAEMLYIMVSSHTTLLLTLSPEERYQTMLLQQPYLLQRVPQYMIASFIGITPEHLSRIRKKMSSK
ncbi:MAG: Crp/Fnr family transcriptional regulator [Chitinophagaceae bacterium]|nr:Crp/Fnr family transcriptional regulator [Chitinophagaceae bacterium]